jgi:SAM-dependent methyltransferase
MGVIHLDEYTQKTKAWLDERFRQCDEDGIYFAHQSIYGFRDGHSFPHYIGKYIRTYQIMKALSHIKFNSFLDAGGGEGYTAWIVRELFNVKVKHSDLSEEACMRSNEIFNIESHPADIHELPFNDGEFDVVLCSETLEHVTDLQPAIDELLRVANKAVIITAPHEDSNLIERNIKIKTPHAHIRTFTIDDFNFLKLKGLDVRQKRMLYPLLNIPTILVEATPVKYRKTMRHSKSIVDLYNNFVSVLRVIFGKNATSFIIRIDDALCNLRVPYNGIIFILLKDSSFYHEKELRKISVREILNFSVPYHYLGKGKV